MYFLETFAVFSMASKTSMISARVFSASKRSHCSLVNWFFIFATFGKFFATWSIKKWTCPWSTDSWSDTQTTPLFVLFEIEIENEFEGVGFWLLVWLSKTPTDCFNFGFPPNLPTSRRTWRIRSSPTIRFEKNRPFWSHFRIPKFINSFHTFLNFFGDIPTNFRTPCSSKTWFPIFNTPISSDKNMTHNKSIQTPRVSNEHIRNDGSVNQSPA